jgi:glyoxylase-like metal-dependent hydrolase (beta-lactamase superfamily II)
MIARALAIAAMLAVAGPAAAQASPLPFTLKQLAPGVYAAIDGPEHKAGSNAGFVIGDSGVLVVDALFTPDAARALVAEIRRLTPRPIRYLVNTHYHADHTGGDQVLRDAGAVIIAHRNVRGWVRTNNIALFGDRITPELKSRIEALPLPDVTTDKDLTIWLVRGKSRCGRCSATPAATSSSPCRTRACCSPATCCGARSRPI